MSFIRSAQLFSIPSSEIPTKASVYLKRYGNNSLDYFNLTSGSFVIDATNFSNLEQKYNKIIMANTVSGFSGNGYLVSSIANPGMPVATAQYPVKTDSSSFYYVYLRGYALGQFSATILIDDVEVSSTSQTLSGWEWITLAFVLPDHDIHKLGIQLKENNNIIDQIYINQSTSIPPVSTDAIVYDASPFITIHAQVYNVVDSLPNEPMFIYDWKTTIEDIKNDDWYNFNLKALDSSNFILSDSYALVLSTSGSNFNNYILWELVDNG